MALYAIISHVPAGAEQLNSAIASAFPTHYRVSPTVWLVSATGTAQEISDKAGITTGISGVGLVLTVSDYFGRANPAVWEWIKTNWQGAKVG